jgi:hypothetical protein
VKSAVTHMDEIPTVPEPGAGEPDWKPLRHYFGISAFGVNVFVARAIGDELIEEHTEETDGTGHEELYLVLAGRVRFTLDGDDHELREGSLVAAAPTSRRGAVALTADATILALGGSPGAPFSVTDWDRRWTSGLPQAADRETS